MLTRSTTMHKVLTILLYHNCIGLVQLLEQRCNNDNINKVVTSCNSLFQTCWQRQLVQVQLVLFTTCWQTCCKMWEFCVCTIGFRGQKIIVTVLLHSYSAINERFRKLLGRLLPPPPQCPSLHHRSPHNPYWHPLIKSKLKILNIFRA
jgi:hypothetical protein